MPLATMPLATMPLVAVALAAVALAAVALAAVALATMPLVAVALAAVALATMPLAAVAVVAVALAAVPVPAVLLPSDVLSLPVLLRPVLVLAARWAPPSSGVPSAFSSSSGPTVRVPLKEGVPGLPLIAEVAPSAPGELFGVPADGVRADVLWAVMPMAAITPAKAASLEPGSCWLWPA
jgi:hypothetical protein